MKTEIIFEISEYSTDAHLRAATKSDNPLVASRLTKRSTGGEHNSSASSQ